MELNKPFNLTFSDYIGYDITLSESGEYCGSDYIPGRFYSGVFRGSFGTGQGIYFRVDDHNIKIGVNTSIKFSKN